MEADTDNYLGQILVELRNNPWVLLVEEDIDLEVAPLQVVASGHTFVSLVVAEIAVAVVVVAHLVHLEDIVLWKMQVRHHKKNMFIPNKTLP